MNKKKYIFFLLQLIIFSFQSIAQVVSNNGAVISVSSGATVNGMGTVVNTAGSIENAGTMIITSDVINDATISGNGTYTIGGNFTNNSVFTAGTSSVTLNGSVLQTIGGSSTTTFRNLNINNASGVTLGTNSNVSGVLNFTSGVINTGANKISITSSGSVTGAGTSKFVNGFLEKYVPMGAGVTNTFEVGKGSTDYLPLNLNFANVTVAGNFTGSVNNGDHADISNVCLDPAKTVNRNWTLTNTGTTFTSYSAVANFAAADKDGGSNAANYFMAIRNAGLWTIVPQGVLTAFTTQGTGITTDGDLQVGEKLFVGTPVFALGSTSERCRAAGVETYSATATNQTGMSYSLDAASLSAGNTINAATGQVTYTAIYVGTSTITATASGCFGPTTAIHQAVTTILPVNAATISGLGCVSIGATQTYSITPVFRASSYVWTSPVNSTILTGQGTNIITVQFNAGLVNGFVTVTPQNACGSSVATSKKEVGSGGAPAKPGAVSGPLVVCSYLGAGTATYSITAVAGASSYLWAKPTGATITGGQGTTSITVTFTSSYSTGNFTVCSVNGCGSSALLTFVPAKLPTTPVSITGIANVYGKNDGVTLVPYSTPAIDGVGSYLWTVPANVTIASGQGTASVNLIFAPAYAGGANISVAASTACGNSAAKTKAIANNTTTPLSSAEQTLSKKNVSCYGLSDGEATISIEGGLPPFTYVWNTHPIQTSATAENLAAGTYTVKAIDKSGHSIVEEITIDQPAELIAEALKINNSLYGYATGYAVASASGGTGVYNYSWNLHPVQNSQELRELEAGSYFVTVTDENKCVSHARVTITDSLVDKNASIAFKLYPVPAINQFTVDYNTVNNEPNSISVITSDGKVIFNSIIAEASSTQKLIVDCSSWIAGMYFVVIRDKYDAILSTRSIVKILK